VFHDPYFEIAKSENEGVVKTKEYKALVKSLQD
jgi:hypothetical protein